MKKKFKPAREGSIAVLPVSNGVDVFTGVGWENWSRFQTTAGYPQLIAGRAITEREYEHVYSLISEGRPV